MAIGLGALCCGVGMGGGVSTLTQTAISIMRRQLERGESFVSTPGLVIFGLLAPIVVGAFFGVRRSLPLKNLWQTGQIAVLSAFGALLVGFAGALADGLLGVPGLLIWAGAAFTLGFTGSRWAEGGSQLITDDPGTA